MLPVFIVAFVLIVIFLTHKYIKDSEASKEKPYTEQICGECGGPDCIVGCDKPDAHTHKPEEITSASFIKPEKERIVTYDEVRHTAYLIASNDNFSKPPETYWTEAEKQLKGK